jgi:hypothetical protein
VSFDEIHVHTVVFRELLDALRRAEQALPDAPRPSLALAIAVDAIIVAGAAYAKAVPHIPDPGRVSQSLLTLLENALDTSVRIASICPRERT